MLLVLRSLYEDSGAIPDAHASGEIIVGEIASAASATLGVVGTASLVFPILSSAAGQVQDNTKTGVGALNIGINASSAARNASQSQASVNLDVTSSSAGQNASRSNAAVSFPVSSAIVGRSGVRGTAAAIVGVATSAGATTASRGSAALTIPIQVAAASDNSLAHIGNASTVLALVLSGTGSIRFVSSGVAAITVGNVALSAHAYAASNALAALSFVIDNAAHSFIASPGASDQSVGNVTMGGTARSVVFGNAAIMIDINSALIGYRYKPTELPLSSTMTYIGPLPFRLSESFADPVTTTEAPFNTIRPKPN